MDFLTKALANLPVVATSPAAFAAYLVVIIAWLVISLRVKRNRQLLLHLEKLPERDRLEALRLEMGVVSLKGKLTAQEWISARIHLYLFIGFCILALVVIVLFAMSGFARPRGELAADVTLQDEGSASLASLTVENAYDGSGLRHWFAGSDDTAAIGVPAPELTLTYAYARVGHRVVITPTMPYWDLLKRGGPIRNVSGIFLWQFPKLSVKLLNNTAATLFVTEIEVRVDSSVLDLEPFLRTKYSATGSVIFHNEGWGAVREPQVQFDVRGADACTADGPPETALPFAAQLPTFRTDAELPFDRYVSPRLKKLADSVDLDGDEIPDCDLCVLGTMTYATDRGERRELKFQSMQNLCGLGGFERAEVYYDLFLKAGTQGYTRLLPVSHSLAPGEAEHFVVRVGTDRSARFDLTFSLREAGGTSIPSDSIELNIFVPRSTTNQVAVQHQGNVWRRRP